MQRPIGSALLWLSLLGLALGVAGCTGSAATVSPTPTGAIASPSAAAPATAAIVATAGSTTPEGLVELLNWPTTWNDLPAPDWCSPKTLGSSGAITDTGLAVYCAYGTTDQSLNDQTMQAYLGTLQGGGFKLVNTTAGYSELTKGSIDVKVHPTTAYGMEIEATR